MASEVDITLEKANATLDRVRANQLRVGQGSARGQIRRMQRFALMLVGGIMIELPILMVLLARVLPYIPNRWANIVLAPLTIVMTLQNGVRDLDDIFFVTVQVVVLLGIVWLAWRWRKAERGPARPNLA